MFAHDWPQINCTCILHSWIAGMYHHAQLICWNMWVLLTFYPSWRWALILPISASQETGIIEICHRALPKLKIFNSHNNSFSPRC
jgi:hypothetical protein